MCGSGKWASARPAESWEGFRLETFFFFFAFACYGRRPREERKGGGAGAWCAVCCRHLRCSATTSDKAKRLGLDWLVSGLGHYSYWASAGDHPRRALCSPDDMLLASSFGAECRRMGTWGRGRGQHQARPGKATLEAKHESFELFFSFPAIPLARRGAGMDADSGAAERQTPFSLQARATSRRQRPSGQQRPGPPIGQGRRIPGVQAMAGVQFSFLASIPSGRARLRALVTSTYTANGGPGTCLIQMR